MGRLNFSLRGMVKLGLALGAFGLAYLSLRDAMVMVFRSDFPTFALRLNAYEPAALTRRFEQELRANPDAVQQALPAWGKSARFALAAEPLSAGPLYIIALEQGRRSGGETAQRTLMRLSERVSRRELAVQAWQIEDAVGRGDVAGALIHYDRALSVHPNAGSMFYPILTGAIDEPEIRAELAPYLRSRKWSSGFMAYMSANVTNYPAAVDLIRHYGGARAVKEHAIYETALLSRLVGTGNFGLARRLASWMTGVDVAGASAFDFSQSTIDPALFPLSWSIGTDENVTADFEPGEGLRVSVEPGERGIAASRVVLLSPGTWRLTQDVEFSQLMPMADATWNVECYRGHSAEKIWSQDVPRRGGRQRYAATFTLPGSCSAARIGLVVRGSMTQGNAEILVHSVRLVRV